jgi:2-polyprenyl-3-methyl-5-hydroxy-6-metoxy-1,4-benzoquinol methylase
MEMPKNYKESNRDGWNQRVEPHLKSDLYDLEGFKKGKTSLNTIELELLGDVAGKSILHLQCHFGQDSLSLARMGANVVGVDLSDKAIDTARQLNTELGLNAEFVCCDVYDSPNHINQKFDIVFTTYGTIGWLPDMDKWAGVIAHFLKPCGRLVFVEFHPVVWMFDDDFNTVAYNYFNADTIVETSEGTYADRSAPIKTETVSWNHNLAEVMTALINKGLRIELFKEYDYSPYNVFRDTEQVGERQYRLKKMGNKLPMVYAIQAAISE